MIGYSTGIFFKSSISLKTQVKKIAQSKATVIEIMLGEPSDLEEALLLNMEDLDQFRHISIHSPSKNITYSEHSTDFIKQLHMLHTKLNAAYTVFHPDIIESISPIMNIFEGSAAIENMDVRKEFGKTALELSPLLEAYSDLKFVCDLNHIFSIDPSMELLKETEERFISRLVAYHVSGYVGPEMPHTELMGNDALKQLSFIKKDVPIIHEGLFTQGKLNDELNLIEKHIHVETN